MPFSRDHEPITDFLTAVLSLQPTAIIGVSGQPRAFTRQVLEAMASFNERPIIFPMSNPTSKSECNAEEAYKWTKGRAIFASGSPFAPVRLKGNTYIPSQANNIYIFPGVGLGATTFNTRLVTDEMFFVAARMLSQKVSATDLKQGLVYPPLTKIREISVSIAAAVAEIAFDRGFTNEKRPSDISSFIKSHMYEPKYDSYI